MVNNKRIKSISSTPNKIRNNKPWNSIDIDIE